MSCSMSNTTGNPLGFPLCPEEGEMYCYIDPIGGASWVYYTFTGYQNGKAVWKYIKTE